MIAGHAIFVDAAGRARCVSTKACIPVEFESVFAALLHDLELASECQQMFGGIPVPVAKAILQNLEPTRAALDLAVRKAEGTVS